MGKAKQPSECMRLARQMEEWLKTEEGQSCTEPSILNTHQVYLQNRIMRAYKAGWEAAKKDKP